MIVAGHLAGCAFAWVAVASACAAVIGCVSAPDEEMGVLEPGKPLTFETDNGLAEGEIVLDGDRVVQGPNTLTVMVVARDPARNASLTGADAFMPSHGHAGGDAVVMDSDPGYRVENVNVFMPGRWEITLQFDIDDQPDRYTFAIEVH